MPHISSRELKKEYQQKLYNELSDALEKSARRSWTKFFLRDFLTRTEKIMLAKRFAVIYMLSEDLPPTYIAEVLLMSPATIFRMSLKYEIGKYSSMLRSLKKDKNKDVWKILEEILRMGLPPKVGRGRWKFLYK